MLLEVSLTQSFFQVRVCVFTKWGLGLRSAHDKSFSSHCMIDDSNTCISSKEKKF